MLNLLTGLLKYKKWFAYAGTVAALMVALYQIYDHIVETGVRKCQAAQQAALVEQYNVLQAEHDKSLKVALKRQSDNYERQLALAESKVKIETRVQEVTKYVDRGIEIPASCDEFAADVVGLLEYATCTANCTSPETRQD